MDHNQAPLLEALADYHRRDRYGFTPPGHRQGRGIDPRVIEVMGLDPFRDDLLASSGLDDRASSHGYLAKAENLMADAVGAQDTFFSTCGSSLSVKAAMLTVAGHDGSLLLGRDAHKSIVAGLIFSGMRPAWIAPQWDSRLHLAHPPSPEQVAEGWKRHPDAAGALIVSPTPYGTCADIAAIAGICHDHGRPLIVDEAWGAHLPFHDDLPTWAMDAGADICVVSVHKMGAGFEQGAVFHVQGELIDGAHLSACADLLMTTSPNVLLYSAIDGWRRQMVQHGTELLGRALELATQLRADISDLNGLSVMEEELVSAEASHDLDRLQVLIDVSELGISGYQAADWMRQHQRIDLGLSDDRRILATLSLGDDRSTTDRLRRALELLTAAADDLPDPKPVHLPDPVELELEMAMLPRDAFFGAAEAVGAPKAVDRIAAEQITPYPPGIPVIIPGERINQAVIDYLLSGLEAGMVLPDPADPELGTIRVVTNT